MEKKESRLLLLLVLVAFVLRLIWILRFSSTADVWGDWWDDAAWSLVQGKGLQVANTYFPEEGVFYSWRMPVFPLFLAGIYFVFGHSLVVARIFLAAISALSCVFVYLIAAGLFNKRTGIYSAAVFSVYPNFIFWTGYMAPETLTIFLLLVTAYFLLREQKKPSAPNEIFSGIFLGLTALTRPQIILFAPFIFIWLWLVKGVRPALKSSVIIFLFLAMTISPWVIRNYGIHHKIVFTSTEAGQVFYIGNNPGALKDPAGYYHGEDMNRFRGMSEMEIDSWYYREGFRFIRENPGMFLKLVADRFVRLWRFYPHTGLGPSDNLYGTKHMVIGLLTSAPIMILGLLGIALSLKEWRRFLMLYLLLFVFTSSCMITRVAIRYREPIMPYLIIFASYAVNAMIKRKGGHAELAE